MMPLFDMLMNAQNGNAMTEMAAKFGLNLEQMNKVTEALMPAFSTGLKRNAASPDAFGQFMQSLASGNHMQYFENASKAFSPSGVTDGNDVLAQLFGSKEVSRAIAAQTEAATGVGQEIVKQMLPIFANTLMGGMFNQANQAMSHMTGQSGMNVFGDMVSQMMGQQKSPSMTNPFGQMMADNPMMKMMSGQQNQKMADNPMMQMMEAMAHNMKKAQDAPNPFQGMFKQPEPEDETPEPEPETPSSPVADMFDQMFETGKVVQGEYQKTVENIFDQFLSSMDKK